MKHYLKSSSLAIRAFEGLALRITTILKEGRGKCWTDPDTIGLWILQLLCEILLVPFGFLALILASHAISRDSLVGTVQTMLIDRFKCR